LIRFNLPDHKTKIVCTIGPSSNSPAILERLIKAGMNIARLNLSHGSIEEQINTLHLIREQAKKQGRDISIMIDLPGPKMRIGLIRKPPLILKKHDIVTLTTKDIIGDENVIPVEYKLLPSLVSKNNIIYLNDGFIQLKVLDVQKDSVKCQVLVGGTLLSHKGLNIPDIKLGSMAVTAHDLHIIDKFLEEDADVFSISFVENEGDIKRVKKYISNKGKDPVIIAKIERGKAVQHIDDILDVADGIMVARGDLGVEIPTEQVPIVQKSLIHKANKKNKIVITATQMLLSMTEHIKPTRAEVTDVANAILDGTDAIMLSEETAMGSYPVESVNMMRKIARITEAERYRLGCDTAGGRAGRSITKKTLDVDKIVANNVMYTIDSANIKFVISDSRTGSASYSISRLKPACWVLSIAYNKKMFHLLNMSYGTRPLLKGKLNNPQEFVSVLHLSKQVKRGERVLIIEEDIDQQGAYYNSMNIITVQGLKSFL